MGAGGLAFTCPVATSPSCRTLAAMSEPTLHPRATWDEYFSRIAREVATRATCPRKHVGAVFVREKIILASGYNGSVRGMPHCTDAGCLVQNDHCVRTVHAEINALAQAARIGVAVNGATAYLTTYPCWPCTKALLNAGIARVVYAESYKPDPLVDTHSTALRVEFTYLPVASQ